MLCLFFYEDGDRERRGNMALVQGKVCEGHRGRDSKQVEDVLRGGIVDSKSFIAFTLSYGEIFPGDSRIRALLIRAEP